MVTTITIMKDTVVVLMEGTPRSIDYGDVINTILATENVKGVHSLRIWALSLDRVTMTAHIVISKNI